MRQEESLEPGLGGREQHPGGRGRGRQMERGSFPALAARRERSRDKGLFIMETRHFQLIYKQLCAAPDRPVFLFLARYSSWSMVGTCLSRAAKGAGGDTVGPKHGG